MTTTDKRAGGIPGRIKYVAKYHLTRDRVDPDWSYTVYPKPNGPSEDTTPIHFLTPDDLKKLVEMVAQRTFTMMAGGWSKEGEEVDEYELEGEDLIVFDELFADLYEELCKGEG